MCVVAITGQGGYPILHPRSRSEDSGVDNLCHFLPGLCTIFCAVVVLQLCNSQLLTAVVLSSNTRIALRNMTHNYLWV